MKLKKEKYPIVISFKITKEMLNRLNRAIKQEDSSKSILIRSGLEAQLSVILKDD